MNPIVKWECNNPDCDHVYEGEFVGKTHLPDTDCPKCGWPDSMVEIETTEDQDGTVTATVTWIE